jgi:nitrogenase molybdenum-iron protein alpha chain
MAKRFGCHSLQAADRSFSQGQQCQQINSIATFLSMEDSVLIIHSPQGCAGCVSSANDTFKVGQVHRGISNPQNARIIITNLDETDIVLGGEEKLREAIRLAQRRYQPRAIFLFASCASGIIGDDIDAVAASEAALANENEGGSGPVILPIHCEGFRSNVSASGFDAAFIALDKYLLKKERQPTQDGLVNLFAPVSISYADQTEMERMLSQIGLVANYVPFFSSLDKLRRLPAAQASTAICKVFADEFMKTLYSDYGVPYSHTVMPIGLRNTELWFRGIAALTNRESEADEIIHSESARVRPHIEAIRRRLEGKRVFICGGTGRSFAAAALIDDFGMELVGMQTPTYDEDAQFDVEHLLNLQGDFILDVANMQPYEQVNLVKKLAPDAFIGVPSWTARLGVPTTHILDGKRPTMGYQGLLYLGEKIANQIENPGFNVKLARYAKLGYKQSWYDTNPFKFIRTEA